MERKIGEIFEYNGEWYQCILDTTDDNCNNCFFQKSCSNITGVCSSAVRSDGKSVAFKKLEKVGEPYFNGQYGKVLQEYKYYIPPITPDLRIHIIKLGIVGIEIKQNKEDMKEKKIKISKEDATYLLNELHYILDERLSGEGSDKVMDDIIQILDVDVEQPNLKPFNLKEAKAGKPVCTRDGRKARIVCFDRKYLYEGQNYPIVALIKEGTYSETVIGYTKDGLFSPGRIDNNDLVMASIKKVGYVNLYHNSNDRYAGYLGNNVIYKDKEFAEKMGKDCPDYIKTIKVEWYE